MQYRDNFVYCFLKNFYEAMVLCNVIKYVMMSQMHSLLNAVKIIYIYLKYINVIFLWIPIFFKTKEFLLYWSVHSNISYLLFLIFAIIVKSWSTQFLLFFPQFSPPLTLLDLLVSNKFLGTSIVSIICSMPYYSSRLLSSL